MTVVDVDGLAAGCLQLRGIGLLCIRVEQQVQSVGLIGIVGRELDTRVGVVVADPYERYATGKHAGTTAENEPVVVVDVPAEAYTRAPERCA